MKQSYKLPDYRGKCLSIRLKQNSYALGLNDPRFEYQGGCLFIIGTVPQGAALSNYALGAQRAILWSRVTDYIVFDDLNSYSNASSISTQFQN